MVDIWKYSDLMKSYTKNKYGFYDIKVAKRVDTNELIFLCYYENSTKIYRHIYTIEDINKLLKFREKKLERILKNTIGI
jgi:hypothetical protein